MGLFAALKEKITSSYEDDYDEDDMMEAEYEPEAHYAGRYENRYEKRYDSGRYDNYDYKNRKRQSYYEDPRQGDSKIVNFHTNVQMQVVLISPKSLEDAFNVCDLLKENKTCVIKLTGLDTSILQRIADRIIAATYVLGGGVQKISGNIFIATPSHVYIDDKIKQELTQELQFNGDLDWTR